MHSGDGRLDSTFCSKLANAHSDAAPAAGVGRVGGHRLLSLIMSMMVYYAGGVGGYLDQCTAANGCHKVNQYLGFKN